ncbi:MFS general substrate transporter [Trichoderma citrinoviride]|uniref:MFS general substrate transporter n=1 Tax=Trichoderma citrinoviride TaxID=58853 RepID=A0A2T4BIC6_9HYPO|nr:MFS general substrate transporter [Trichoderma citrinoviride]PTB69009.1 MFS general substrate transporter [Trichoderma citrinoviride]
MDEKVASPVTSSHGSSLDDPAAKTAELKRIYRKIDMRLVPLMFFCYFLQFLDKVIVNYANIMGIAKNLHFVGNDFSWMATAFFIGYAVAEFPQGYLIQKFPVSKVLGFNVLLWGIVVCCTAATQNFAGAAAVRTLLGMFEAVITPALIMITSQWYNKKQATLRTGIWYCGLGGGQVMGGLISWAAQHGSTTSFQSWRIMFVAVGVFNLFVALAVIIVMPSGVREAAFLTEDEKALIEEVLARDQAGAGKKVFRASGILDALKDLQVWLLFLNTILIVIPSGIITTFSATIINSIFLTPKKSALLNMPAGAISIFATFAGTYVIYYNLPRWLSIIGLLIPTIIGAGLMSFAKSNAGALAGVYLINFDVAPLALIYALVGANTQGYTKKVTVNVIIAIAFSIANIIGPQTFQDKDKPKYLPAKITVLGVAGASIVVTILLRILYGMRNAKTAAARQAELEAIRRGEIDAKAPPALVVVTGANGFIAQHCVAALLREGYRVVGTVRNQDKVAAVKKAHKEHPGLEVVVIEDITNAQNYLDIIGPLSPAAVLHLAAPFHYKATDFEREMMIPAVQGSTAILEAAAQIKSIRRVVQTNSFASIYDASAGLSPEKTYSDKDWSPLTYEDGVKADNAPLAYRASKAAAEKAAWKFMESQVLGFDLVSLCPGMVFGPFLPEAKPTTIAGVNTSNQLVWAAVSAGRDAPVPPTRGPVWVDVRDVADAHVKALQVVEAGGSRFLLASGVYCNQELCDVSRRALPKYADRIPIGEPGKRDSHTHFGVSSAEAERVLGVQWRSLEESLKDVVPQLFEVERGEA